MVRLNGSNSLTARTIFRLAMSVFVNQSTFAAIGQSEYDYQGRTYMHVPLDLDVNLLNEPSLAKIFLDYVLHLL